MRIYAIKKLFAVIEKSLLFFLSWAVLTGLLPIPDSSNGAIWRFWAELIPFLTVAGISLLFLLWEKRKIKLHIISSPLKNCVLSIICGASWLGSATAILLLSGTMRITGSESVPLIWLWIISALINTAMQELLVRGYLYQMLKTNYNAFAAAIATTSLFSFLHGGAFEAGLVPVLNVVTMSLMMTLILEYTQSLLTPIIVHFTWNSVGSIILGAVALADDYPQLCRTEFSGNVLLSGGAPKMEGSIVVLILNLLFIAVFALLLKKKKH